MDVRLIQSEAALAESRKLVLSLLDQLKEYEAERDALRDALAGVTVSAGVPDYVVRNCEAALKEVRRTSTR